MIIKKFLSILAYIAISFVIIVAVVGITELPYYEWLQIFSIIIIITLVVQLFFLRREGIKWLSYTILFICLTYLFHFGQIILVGLFPNYKFQGANFLLFVNQDILKEAANFSLFSIIMLILGVLIAKTRRAKIQTSSKINMYTMRNVAWILIVLFFPLKIYVDIRNIISSLNGGYLEVFVKSGSIDGIIISIGYIAFAGFALLMMIYSLNNKKMAFKIYIFVNIYLAFTMLSGGRGHQIMLILFFLYLEHRMIYRINFKKAIPLLLVVYSLIIFLNSIVEIRSEGIKSVEQFITSIQSSIEQSPILKLTEEMGGSIYTPYLTILQQENDIIQPAWGSSYIKGLCNAVPNMGGVLTDCMIESHFANQLDTRSIGGSFIAESYFNFQYFGLILIFCIGVVIRKFSNYLDIYIEEKKFLAIAILLPVFTYGLWWIRDAFGDIVRPFFWGMIVIFAITIFVGKFEKEKK